MLQLPPAQREVVLLRVEGLTFAEISRVTLVGTNPPRVLQVETYEHR
ncbi:MAG: hypothetical protein JNK82_43710 [Myxococcaceae bacterium]|nr:hypothetical protein [Myxococcaceae bacterium]